MPYGTINADQFTTSDNVTSSGLYGFKNRIINGAMVIDQRNAGASVTANDGIFGADRFKISTGYTSKATIQQSTTVPSGFKNSILITSSAATSTAAGDYMTLIQPIEGLNVSDLGWGAAGAATVTLSFWVQSSLTGTFGGSINNSGNARSYVFSYTISAANTWEQKTVTIAGDTSGTWLTTNGIGIVVRFSIAMGSTYTNTAGAWYSGDYEGATGQVNVLNTNGATFYITGVQLEKGSTATSFDYRPYTTEVQLCQRYYEELEVLFSTASWAAIANQAFWKVTKRATPTLTNLPDSGTGGAYTTFGSSNAKFATQCNQIFQNGSNSGNSGGVVRGNSEL